MNIESCPITSSMALSLYRLRSINKIFLLFGGCPNSHPFSSSATSSEPSNPNQSDSATNFLLNDLGFSYSEISRIQNKYPRFFRTKAPLKRSVEAVELLRSYGFTAPQLKKMFTQCQSALFLRANETLRPRLELIKGLGLSNEELATVLCKAPRILNTKRLQANIAFYRSVYDGNATLVAAFKIHPAFLAYNLRTKVSEHLNILKQYGFCDDTIRLIIRKAPWLFSSSTDVTHLRIEFLKNSMGFDNSKKRSASAFAMSVRISLPRLYEKYKQLSLLGFSDEQLKKAIQNCPMLLASSFEKIQKNMAYLKENGVPLDLLVKYPVILGFSLEKRIRPRHRAFEFLSETWSMDKLPSLPRLIQTPQRIFINKYVEGNPLGPKLLEICKCNSQIPQ